MCVLASLFFGKFFFNSRGIILLFKTGALETSLLSNMVGRLGIGRLVSNAPVLFY